MPQQRAKQLLSLSSAVIVDTETTGLWKWAEIVDISIIDLGWNTIFDSLVLPYWNIEAGAQEVHWISKEFLENNKAPTWDKIYDEIKNHLKWKSVIIYNSPFDTRMISQTNRKYKLPDFEYNPKCAMNIFSEFHWEWNDYYWNYKWHKLTKAAHICKVPIENAHRALWDCIMTLWVLKYVANN